MEIKRVSVLGAGLMGHGIAQVCAQGGLEVTLEDIKEDFLQKGLDRVKKYLQGSVERKKMTREKAETVLSRIKVSTSLKEAAENADLVVEAILENMEIKKEINAFAFGKVSLDFKKLEAFKNNVPIDLSATEFNLLKYFIEREGEVITRHQLLDDVWGYENFPTTRTIDNFILNIRKKIEDVPSNPKHLLTVHKAGYKFVK